MGPELAPLRGEGAAGLSTNLDSPAGESISRRALYALQAVMRTVAQSQRERDCGRLVCIEDNPEIRVRSEEGQRRASFNGLLRCGHVWTCAPCSQRIRARQARRITGAVEYLAGSWCMLTLTIRHDGAMRLRDTLRALKRAWRRMRQRRDLRDRWKSLAFAPVTATEISYGDNGWHPHLHVAFKLGRDLDDETRDLFALRWREAIVAELGPRARPNDRGVVWSRAFEASKDVDRALYVAKLGIVLEVSDAGLAKQARSSWEIARRAAGGDARAFALWIEYCEATKGLHVLQLSPEAAEAARKAEELKTEECYGREQEHVEPENIEVPCHVIRAMRAREVVQHTVFHDALRAAETRGREGFWAWVRETFPLHVASRYDAPERSPP